MSTKVKVSVKQTRWSSEFEVNGVRLTVSDSGLVKRYVEVANQHYQKGWNIVSVKPNKKGYLGCELSGKSYKVHRLVYYGFNQGFNLCDSSMDNSIDHINGDPSDNRLVNLRLVTNSQNQMNSKTQCNNKSGYKNIHPLYFKNTDSWYWRVAVIKDGIKTQRYFLGGRGSIPDSLPPVPQIVIDYRDQMLTKIHGDFANLD